MGKAYTLIEKIGRRGEKLLQGNLSSDEEIVVKLKGLHGEAVVITNKKLFILKWGIMVGNTFGGRCLAFDYRSITGLEYKKRLVTGSFEVLSAATQNTRKSYWGLNDNTSKSDNIVSFGRDKYKQFEEATRIGREMIHERSGGTGQVKSKEADNLEMLEKLGELQEMA